MLVSLIFSTSTEAAEPQPTLTSVSIDSDNATSSGANETAKVGDTVTLSFTADETIQAPTVAFTVGGASAAGSVTFTKPLEGDWSAVAAGWEHTVGLKSDGTLWAWGSNSHGQLGDGTTVDKTTPTQIGSATSWSAVATGRYHTVGLRSDGTLWAWGRNNYGQLGDGTNASKYTPTQTIQAVTGTDWTAVFTLASGDTAGAVAFTIDFADLAGTAGTQVTSTTDGTSVTPATIAGAPTNVSATDGNTQATVTWSAPSSDGGSAITGYTVTASPGGATATWSSGALAATVTGLTNGTSYTFTVIATNSIGNGAASSASNAVTPTPLTGTAQAYFEPLTLETKPSDEFVIAVVVDPGVSGVSGGEVLMAFPPAVLEVMSHEPGTILGANPIVGTQELDQSSGFIRMAVARQGSTSAPTEPGRFLKVRFRVKEGAPVGNHHIILVTFELSDERFVNIVVSPPTPAVIQVGPLLPGDANDDDLVDFRDLAMLGAAYGMEEGDLAFDTRVDFNGDGVVDYRDLAMLGANYGQQA
ncbi:MAG: fibronectin type III domain-containing protein [Acidimicrobiales bacterium]|nr:fibronectin type III domain-containing protein [Acidimicrobiales bacterium]